ncbi:MAG TPA: hypothetical protein VER11_31455 [Polyangiaceae bacterium]|nr:hypothetical protein [Polyangiaceae bacterium]
MTVAAVSIPVSQSSNRIPDAEVDAQFVERWSRRALSERPLSAAQIQSLFEAARWAPSPDSSDVLPRELHEKEQPNARKSTHDFAFEGRYQLR